MNKNILAAVFVLCVAGSACGQAVTTPLPRRVVALGWAASDNSRSYILEYDLRPRREEVNPMLEFIRALMDPRSPAYPRKPSGVCIDGTTVSAVVPLTYVPRSRHYVMRSLAFSGKECRVQFNKALPKAYVIEQSKKWETALESVFREAGRFGRVKFVLDSDDRTRGIFYLQTRGR